VPNFLLCGEEDYTFENFNGYKNRSFSICDETIFGGADEIFGGYLGANADLVKEKHHEVSEALGERKQSRCGG
jgi:hypothetical protein